MRIDMHFHSKFSDGRLTAVEIIELAKQKWAGFIACTEHDVINTEFPKLAREAGFKSVEAVEISWKDRKYDKHLHFTCYAQKFSQEVHEVLDSSRAWRQDKMRAQISLLQWHWFIIDWKNFLEFYRERWVNVDNFNSSHLSSYVYMQDTNIALVEKLTGEKLDRDWFVKNCLKDEWRYPWIWAVLMPEYEPSIEKCSEMARDNNAILSLAHPNFKLTQNQFRERIAYYLELGINAVEINAKANKSWVDLILEYREKLGYILTFWSDCHFKENDDNEHWEFLAINPFISEQMISLNNYYIQKKLWILPTLNIPESFRDDLWADILEYAKTLKEYSRTPVFES
ncbi:MAG: metal-dependent phosphoesterase [uncultured bacterium (gcode 4)]|uniref:Metal-dependent phosphoesterase n=1 Tax=uncultured bacterium (gcode 4) TaxID=1234023 RepID=K2GHF6_9BACT|nr:MAG: metal-dependent phosphoesterase [uncultured bacterium (gcode 4)]